VITIKKYPNRRLYDTSKSQYINLENIKSLVKEQLPFKVIDSKTEQDLTKSILLQIICEQEAHDEEAILTQAVLQQFICLYGGDLQSFMRQYLDQSVRIFLEHRQAFQSALQEQSEPADRTGLMNPMFEQNQVLARKLSAGVSRDEAMELSTAEEASCK